jgi:predicted Zn finger-like uncharacterized protein
MIINITCPNCHFSKNVPKEKIPEGIKYAKCPRCSNTFEITAVNDQDADSKENESMDSADDINTYSVQSPADETGYFTGLWKKLTGVLFSPVLFFSSVRYEEGVTDPFAFGILIGSIGFMFDIFWTFLLRSKELSFILETLSKSININNLFLGYIIISPFLVLLFMLVSTLVLNFCLFILRGSNRGITGTFRVSAYSNAALIFCLIPYIGGYIALVWWLIVLVIGLKAVHETSTLKALFSLLIPLFFLLVPVIAAVILFASIII